MTIKERIENLSKELDPKAEIIGVYKDEKNFKRYEKVCTKYGDKYQIYSYCKMKDMAVEYYSTIKPNVIAIFFSKESFLNLEFQRELMRKLEELKFDGNTMICKSYSGIVK